MISNRKEMLTSLRVILKKYEKYKIKTQDTILIHKVDS